MEQGHRARDHEPGAGRVRADPSPDDRQHKAGILAHSRRLADADAPRGAGAEADDAAVAEGGDSYARI